MKYIPEPDFPLIKAVSQNIQIRLKQGYYRKLLLAFLTDLQISFSIQIQIC